LHGLTKEQKRSGRRNLDRCFLIWKKPQEVTSGLTIEVFAQFTSKYQIIEEPVSAGIASKAFLKTITKKTSSQKLIKAGLLFKVSLENPRRLFPYS
jgi:hypothetical protein